MPLFSRSTPRSARGYRPGVRSAAVASLAVLAAAGGALTGSVDPADAEREAHASRSVHQSKHLWATVNVCDTARRPNTVGIRASMPGSGRRGERMWMRFQVQYLSSADGRWHNVGPGGDSGFVDVGSARYRARQAGRNFVLKAPPAGRTYQVRGAVTFEWRRAGETVRRARKRTRRVKRSTAGADPRGFSAAVCEIR